MPLLTTLRHSVGYHKRVREYGSVETARMIQRNLANIIAPLRPQDGMIRLDRFGLTLDPARHEHFITGMRSVERIVDSGTGRFGNAPDGEIEFQTEAVRLVPETLQELYILEEIYREGLYDVDSGQEWLAWDVGMNVGMAAAFFAGVKGWETVGYEPFPMPFEAAVQNLLRSGLQALAHPQPIGVSNRNETLRLMYNGLSRGSNGLYGNNALDKSGEDVEVEVSFCDAAEVVDQMVARAAGRPIFAKIDCEGSEYAIVRRLRETGLLTALTAISMEFHLLTPEHDYDSLLRDLTESGFVVRGQRLRETHVGFLFAVSPEYRSK